MKRRSKAEAEIAQLKQDLDDMTWDRNSLNASQDRWIEKCRTARDAVVEMMARGARPDDAAMLKRWDGVQLIRMPKS